MNNRIIYTMQALIAHQTELVNALLQERLEAENPPVTPVDGCVQQQKAGAYNAMGNTAVFAEWQEENRQKASATIQEQADLIAEKNKYIQEQQTQLENLARKLHIIRTFITCNSTSTEDIRRIISTIL